QKCQSKLSEVIAGAETLTVQNDVPFSDNPPNENWLWAMDVNQGVNGVNNLWQGQVRGYRGKENGNKYEVSLSQLILDAMLRGAPNPPASSSSSSTSGTTGSTTGG